MTRKLGHAMIETLPARSAVKRPAKPPTAEEVDAAFRAIHARAEKDWLRDNLLDLSGIAPRNRETTWH